MFENGQQVAELRENGELVGVVRGCIKSVGTKFEGQIVKLGCILGLRVSPRHRYILFYLSLSLSLEVEYENYNDLFSLLDWENFLSL